MRTFLRWVVRVTAILAAIGLAGFALWLSGIGPLARLAPGLATTIIAIVAAALAVNVLALCAEIFRSRRLENSLHETRAELDDRVEQRTAALAEEVKQRARAEAELRKLGLHLGEAQRLANLGSWNWNAAQNRVTWSDQLYEIYGLAKGEFGGTFADFLELLHPDDRVRIEQQITDAFKNGAKFEFDERIIRPDGETRYLRSIGEPSRDDNDNVAGMVGVCLDITDRRLAESNLRETEEIYELLVKGVHDYAIYMLSPEGNVASWNAGAARIKQYEAEEIIGRHFSEFYTDVDRANEIPKHALATAEREGKYEAEGWRRRKDGTQFWASVVVDAIRSSRGDLIGFAKITRDITERKRSEAALVATREQLAQAQKMEALGQLTGGIAHDFNNLLMIMSGHAQILQRRLTEPKDIQAIEAIRLAASRGENLTRQLLAFSRRQALNPVPIDLRQRIEVVRGMLSTSLRGNIDLTCDVQDDVWPVAVDLGELDLALVNIAVNARDAMPNGGTISLKVRNVTLRPGAAAGNLDGDFVALAMTDTGGGIAPELMTKVFEPFFTTKPVGKGTGLGLSQVHGFASQSGGGVTVDSKVGDGTTVTIYLPRSTQAVTADIEQAGTAHSDVVRGTVLVVEDSREVAKITTTLLEQLGYRVVLAETAAEALRHLQQGVEVNVLFSDIVMPGGMNGIELAVECEQRYPALPILLTSGYTDAAQAAENRFTILRKPFEMSALERSLNVLLSGREAPARLN